MERWEAFGMMGGYIAGSAKLIDFFRSYTPAFIFTTPLPSALAAGALASVRYLRSSSAERDSLQERIATVRRRLFRAALPLMPFGKPHGADPDGRAAAKVRNR